MIMKQHIMLTIAGLIVGFLIYFFVSYAFPMYRDSINFIALSLALILFFYLFFPKLKFK